MNPDLTAFVNAAVAEAKAKRQQVAVPAALQAVATGKDFCAFWPAVKDGLKVLEGMVPVWAKWLITAVIAIGDGICKG